MEKPGLLEISETRFHHLGKQTIKHQKPKETWFPVQTNQPAVTLSPKINLVIQDFSSPRETRF
jgi:hypothetical protein